VVRPPRLIDEEPTGEAVLPDDAPGLTAKPVPRADVATAMLGLVTGGGWERLAPYVVRPASRHALRPGTTLRGRGKVFVGVAARRR